MNNPFRHKIIIKGNKENIPKDVDVSKMILPPGPIVFETRKQYVDELIHNQEKVRGIDFSKKQEKVFEKAELKKMAPVIARYTTKSNPYMKPETVFFTDEKISKDMLPQMARHEFQHFAWEPFDSEKGDKNMKMGQTIPIRAHPKFMFNTDFSSKNMTLGPRRTIGMALGPKRYGMQIKPVDPNVIKIGPDKMRMSLKKNINSDFLSKNMAWDVAWAKKEGFHVERMSPEKYLEKTNTKSDEPFLEKYRDFDTHTSEPIEKLQEHIKNPDVKVQIPYIGKTSSEHEGRHRAKAAMDMGLKEIPVITQRPESHRTPEIAEEFIKKQFPQEIEHETGYGMSLVNEWRGRFKKSFPEEHMDNESMKAYKDILKEKDLDKDPGKFEYEYIEPKSDVISQNMKKFQLKKGIFSDTFGKNMRMSLKKNIKSDFSSRNMAWTKGIDAENIPIAKGDYGESYGNERAYEKKRVMMNPDEFLRRQHKMSGHSDKVSFEEWSSQGDYKDKEGRSIMNVDPKIIESMKKSIKSSTDEVPVPIELYERQTGDREDFQEGRHRGIAAKELGEDIPVILARKKYPPWDRPSKDKVFSYTRGQINEDNDTEWDKALEEFPEDKE